MLKEHKTILLGTFISIIFLIIFFLLQWNESKLLGLDSKWIAFSAIPIILTLFVGGFIKSFKGFGIEVEANLNKPILRNYNLILRLEAEEVPKFDKRRVSELFNLPESSKRKIKRLTFIYGKKNYYDEGAIRDYISQLPNLEYVEIVDSKKKFKYLLRIDILKEGGDDMYWETNHKFIEAIENRKIPTVYTSFYEAKPIKTDESIIEVYKKLKTSYLGIMPIVNEKSEMIGLIDYHRVAIQIADELVDAKLKQN